MLKSPKSNYRKIRNIAIFGGSEAKVNSTLYREVALVAKTLAQRGYVIVNGGGPGVMMAATQGAVAAGGQTLAITFSPRHATGFEGRYVKNHTDKVIKTSNYIERIFSLMEHADCYVIFNGGTGTISEFGLAWCLARLYYGHHKPFILYGRFWEDITQSFNRHMMMRNHDHKVYKIVASPTGVLSAIHRFDTEIEGVDHSKCKVCSERAFMR